MIVGKLFDPGKIPPEERFDPEKLALDLHRSGTKASYTPDVDAIVKQLAESAAPGDVVCVLSSGSFDGLHDKLLDAIGDAMRPARVSDMPAVRELLATVGLSEEPARDDQARGGRLSEPGGSDTRTLSPDTACSTDTVGGSN